MCLAPKTTEPEVYVALTLESENKKTGPIPVATIASISCPPTCPFIHGNGCYAGYGKVSIHWSKVDNGERGVGWGPFCTQIAALAIGTLWRYGQAGDVPHKRGLIDNPKLSRLVVSNKGKRVIAYTHHKLNKHNVKALLKANANGFTVNASCETSKGADRAIALGLPAVIVLSAAYNRKKSKGKSSNWLESMSDYMKRIRELGLSTPDDNKIWVCPATYSDDITCKTCKACSISKRETSDARSIIPGFPVHGVAARIASEIVDNLRGMQ